MVSNLNNQDGQEIRGEIETEGGKMRYAGQRLRWDENPAPLSQHSGQAFSTLPLQLLLLNIINCGCLVYLEGSGLVKGVVKGWHP